MTKPTETGMNRTGMGLSPLDKRDMMENARLPKEAATAVDGAEADRIDYIDGAPPVGTVPLPSTLKGAVKAVAQALKGERANVLIDKLGERLAFERTGARLYEAVMVKRRALGETTTEPSLADLERVHRQEVQHAHLVREAMEGMGADPTAETPAADLIGVTSSGILKIVTDPRTTLMQSLEAMLVAELADFDGWQLLIDLAREMGQADMARGFEVALQEEQEHVRLVRAWVVSMARKEAQITEAPTPQPTAH